MLNKLSILTRTLLLTLVAIIMMGWLNGDLIMESLPPSVSSTIDKNILLPIKKISTNCYTVSCIHSIECAASDKIHCLKTYFVSSVMFC